MQALVIALSALLLPASHAKLAPEWAGPQLESLFTVCEKGRVAYTRQLKALQTQFFTRMQNVTVAELLEAEGLEDKNKPNPFLEMGRIMWPQFLPEKYPGRLVFVECGSRFRQLNEAAAKTSELKIILKDWKNCLDENYRDSLPKLTERLLTCYKRMSNN